MRFHLFRFLLFLTLPAVLIGAVVFGTAVVESYGKNGEYTVPQNPVAQEPARFFYQLTDPVSKEPLRNASVHLAVEKTEALNPWLYTGYLREDNRGTGLVFETDSSLYDGKIELKSNFWDAGKYLVSIHASAPGLQTPVDVKIPVEVKVPFAQLVRTVVLFVLILLAAAISGYVAGSLENPFRKGGSGTTGSGLRKSSATVAFLLAAGIAPFGSAPFAWAHGEGVPSASVETVSQESGGVRAELKINPAKPVQKGEPAHFTLTFQDTKTGQPVRGMDAAVALNHVDDNLTMFATRTQIQNGQLEFDYAFPDAAKFEIVVHAAPNSPQSTLSAPFDGKFSFEVPPVHPNPGAQIRAGILMLAAMIGGFAIGVAAARRRKNVFEKKAGPAKGIATTG